jgi:phosphate transport system substrate-binding protein
MKTLKEQDSDRHKEVCTKIREDGAYVESGENDNLLVQKVAANPGSVGVLGYSFFQENADKLNAVPIGGIAPTAAIPAPARCSSMQSASMPTSCRA